MANVRIFFDTEFTDLKKDCELISIGCCAYVEGLVDNDGDPVISVFYAESMDFSEDLCSDFVRGIVLPRLMMVGNGPIHEEFDDQFHNKSVAICGTDGDIGMALYEWIRQFEKYTNEEKIEIWSDCLAYDWVLFCDLLGNLFDMTLIGYIPFDLSTVFLVRGIDPDITRETFACKKYGNQIEEIMTKMGNRAKHNSLFDAMIIYFCWKTIMEE